LKKLPPLYVIWLGLSLAAAALFAEAVRGFANVPPPRPLPLLPPAAKPPDVATKPPLPSSVPDPSPPAPGTPPGPAGADRKPAPVMPRLPDLPALPEEGPPPVVHVDDDTADFGTILQGTEAPHTFVFRNRGRGTLRLVEAVTSCGCAAVMPEKREIPAGGSGKLKVIFKSGSYVGKQHKTIAVRTNDPRRPVTVLHMRAVVRPLFLFDPPVLSVGEIPRGTPVVREVTLRETQGRPFTVRSVRTTLTFVKAELLPPAGGGGATRRLRVTIRPDGVAGGFVGHVALKVDRKGVTPAFVVQGVIAGDVGIFPRALFLGMVRQDQAFPVQSLVLRARGNDPIAVKAVETDAPWLKAELKTVIPEKVYQIDLTVDPTPPPGRFEQAVRITTSDPPPPYAVTISGVVRKIK
jgi:hypothetical protein